MRRDARTESEGEGSHAHTRAHTHAHVVHIFQKYFIFSRKLLYQYSFIPRVGRRLYTFIIIAGNK